MLQKEACAHKALDPNSENMKWYFKKAQMFSNV